MARCVICDYVDGYGSELTDRGPLNNRVIFNTKRQEFVCTDCSSMISETISEMSEEDFLPPDQHDHFGEEK